MTDKAFFSVRCLSDLNALAPLRSFVSEIARRHGYTEQEINEIELSVDEACANAIEHANSSEGNSYITLDVFETEEELSFKISDRGTAPFNADIDDSGIGSYATLDRDNFRGLGLLLMKKFMDYVEFSSTPEQGTVVILTRKKKQM